MGAQDLARIGPARMSPRQLEAYAAITRTRWHALSAAAAAVAHIDDDRDRSAAKYRWQLDHPLGEFDAAAQWALARISDEQARAAADGIIARLRTRLEKIGQAAREDYQTRIDAVGDHERRRAAYYGVPGAAGIQDEERWSQQAHAAVHAAVEDTLPWVGEHPAVREAVEEAAGIRGDLVTWTKPRALHVLAWHAHDVVSAAAEAAFARMVAHESEEYAARNARLRELTRARTRGPDDPTAPAAESREEAPAQTAEAAPGRSAGIAPDHAGDRPAHPGRPEGDPEPALSQADDPAPSRDGNDVRRSSGGDEGIAVDASPPQEGQVLPADATPVDGVDGYHYAYADDRRLTVYGPDHTPVATAVYPGDGMVAGARIPSRWGNFPLLAASQHRAAHLPAEQQDRVRIQVVADAGARAGYVVEVRGTGRDDARDRLAVKTVGHLQWSGKKRAWVSVRTWTEERVQDNFARLLTEFARQNRRVVVGDQMLVAPAAAGPPVVSASPIRLSDGGAAERPPTADVGIGVDGGDVDSGRDGGVVVVGEDDRGRDGTSRPGEPAAGVVDGMGAADGGAGVRGAGGAALEAVPADGLRADSPDGAAGLLRGVGGAGPDPDRGAGPGPGRSGPGGRERPGQAGPAEHGPDDGRGAGGPGVAASGAGDPGLDGPRTGGTGTASIGGDEPTGVVPPSVTRFVPAGQGDLAPAGAKAKARANVDALQVLRTLQEQRRPATAEEQQVLARWAGWGSLAEQLFGANPGHAEAFADERAAVQGLLSEQEREAALDSTLNAHYTDAAIASAIWEALGGLGVRGGQVLEPGCGSGNFIGLAPDGVQMVGVELDPTTAAIAAALYPDAVVVNQDLADFTVPDGTFDAVVGNVPFGTRRPFDPAHNPGRRLSLHNYVISKALGQTRPGGLVAVVTSRYTLDSLDEGARRQLHDRASFLGAVRLPSGAHQAAAGTQVVTDVLLLRRRLPDEVPDREETWLHAGPLPRPGDTGDVPPEEARTASAGDAGTEQVNVNDYFVEHPEQVLGRMRLGQGSRGRPDLVVAAAPGDLGQQLRQALDRVVEQARDANRAQTPRVADPIPVRELLAARVDLPEGQLVRHGDGFALVESGRLVDVRVPKTRAAEMTDLLALRDAAVEMLNADLASSSDTDASRTARDRVNALYDTYRARYGPINRGRWVASAPKDVILPEPDRVPVADLVVGDIVRWPGTDKAGRARRAVVEQVDEDSGVRVAVVGVQGRARHQHIRLGSVQAVTKLGTRHRRRRFVREAPAAFDLDERASLVLALESYDQDSGTAEKTTLLTERLVRKPPQPGTVDDPDDALTIVLDDTGVVDLDAVAALMGTDEATARDRLGTRVFTDHDSGVLVPAVEYLSGDVRAKLAAAETAATQDASLAVNVETLRQVLPAWKHADEIKAYPGASWIPVEDLRRFLADILQDEGVQVTREQGEGWRVAAGRARSHTDPLTTSEWGTPYRDAYTVFEAMLRRGKLTVRTKEEGIDKEATAAAYAAADRVRLRFEEWVWEDPERAARLEGIYNEQLNSLIPPRYPTAPLHPPGMTELVTLAPHQAAAVRRICAEPGVLVTHRVGAGKTFTLVAGMMELKRLGHVRKPMLVVPNHLKEQWQLDWLTLYPNARVLAASTEDLNRVGRDRFLGRAATGDWDVVIVTKEVFRSIPVSRSTAHAYVQTELAETERQIDRIESDGADSRTVKEERQRLARRRDRVEESLAAADSTAWTFETLGVDHIGVDEIHDYKNLARASGSAEHSLEGSARSMDLHVKTGWLWATSESGRVLSGATATPLLNSFGEIHTWMRYFRPSSRMAAAPFDTFLANHALSSVKYEMTAAGQREAKERVRDYRNFSGVMRAWLDFADVAQVDLDVPDIDAGQPENVIVPPPAWLVGEYLPHLAERAEAIAGLPRRKGQDTMPVILADGLAAALDPRAVGGPDIGPAGKLPWVADRVAAIYQQTRHNRYDDPLTGGEHPTPGAFQFVFLDLGTPGASKRYATTMAKIAEAQFMAAHQMPDDPPVDVPVRVSEQVGFEAYEELKAALIARGVPAKAIVFMHDAGGKDAKKAEIYRRAREGDIAVLVGSTQLMGTGVNAQTRAVALHNVDCPYRAADLEQRNGRIVRQGNQNPVVRVINYATGDSHDEVKWQAVQRKAQLLGRVAAGDLTVDEISELGDDLGIEEMTAQLSGSPAKIDKSRVDQELMTLAAARKAFHRAQDTARYALSTNRLQLAETARRADHLTEQLTRLTRRAGSPVGGYTATIAGREVGVRTEATAAIRTTVTTAIDNHRGMVDGPAVPLGVFGGFEVHARVVHNKLLSGKEVQLWFPELTELTIASYEAAKNDTVEYLARIVNALDRLEPLSAHLRAALPGLQRNIDNAERMLGRDFRDEQRYQALTRRADRLTELVAWEDSPDRGADESPPPGLTADPADVVAVLGELRAETANKERPAPASLANVTDDGQRIPRHTTGTARAAELRAAGEVDVDTPPGAGTAMPGQDTAIAVAAPDAEVHRVNATMTHIRAPEPDPGRDQPGHRLLYATQPTRDGQWAVYAPGNRAPLTIRPTRGSAETWALTLARTGALPDTAPGITTGSQRSQPTPAPHTSSEDLPAPTRPGRVPATAQDGVPQMNTPTTTGTDQQAPPDLHPPAEPTHTQTAHDPTASHSPPEKPPPPRPIPATDAPAPEAGAEHAPGGPAWAEGFTPREQAFIRIATDDWAGRYYNSPVGGLDAAIRYTVEGHLKQLAQHHTHGELREAVTAYLDSTPEALHRSYTRDELDEREARRVHEDDLLREQSFEAFQAGDHDRALALIDQAEQVNPVAGERHDEIRRHIQGTATRPPLERPSDGSAHDPAGHTTTAVAAREAVAAPEQPSIPEAASAPQLVIEHTAAGSLVFGTDQADRTVRAALHDTGWHWSRRIGTDLGYSGAWWLSRKEGHGLRTGKVEQLRARLDALGRPYRYEQTQRWRQERDGMERDDTVHQPVPDPAPPAVEPGPSLEDTPSHAAFLGAEAGRKHHTAPEPESVTDPAAPTDPPASALARFTPTEQIHLRQTVEDWVGYYRRSVRLSREAAVRRTVEERLELLTAVHDRADIAAAVQEHMTAHPELLNRTVSDRERARRAAARAEHAQPLIDEALRAYRAGDHAAALRQVAEAELLAPRARNWQKIRELLKAEAPATPAELTDAAGPDPTPPGEPHPPEEPAAAGTTVAGETTEPGQHETPPAAEPQTAGQLHSAPAGPDTPDGGPPTESATTPRSGGDSATGHDTLSGTTQPEAHPTRPADPALAGQRSTPDPQATPGARPRSGDAVPTAPERPPAPPTGRPTPASRTRQAPTAAPRRPQARTPTATPPPRTPPGLLATYTTAEADLAQLHAEVQRAREGLDAALAAGTGGRSDVSVGEAALLLLEAAYTSAHRHLDHLSNTPAWQQATRVWESTRQAWTSIRATAAEWATQAADLLRMLADHAARALTGLAEQATAQLDHSGRQAPAARAALTELAAAGRTVHTRLTQQPLSPAAAALHSHLEQYDTLALATNARFITAQRAFDTARQTITSARPDPTPPGPVRRSTSSDHGPKGENPADRTAAPRLTTIPPAPTTPPEAADPTRTWRERLGQLPGLPTGLADEPGFLRLVKTLQQAEQEQAEREQSGRGGPDLAKLLPRLAEQLPARGSADALRYRLVAAGAVNVTRTRPASERPGVATRASTRPIPAPPTPPPPRPAARR